MSDGFLRALTDVDELSRALRSDAAPVLLDVRWQLGGPSQLPAYLAGHLPGARWCELDTDLADPAGPRGRHPLPDPSRLQVSMRRWGLHADSDVVVYDGGSSLSASRAWWVLRWAGQRRVRVLDGGLAAWLAASLPLQAEVEAVPPGSVSVQPGSLPTLDAAAAQAWAAEGRLVDVRAPERFRGEVEPIDPVPGRIPAAINLPSTGNLVADRFASVPVLRQRFAAAADTAEGKPLGVYCGSGVTAAHTVLAMHLAGVEAVLYPGSWSEWITDPGRPVEIG
ncbi:MAG: sulfurtransferase [Jatrophihabitans sp.]